jgi:hypothetical protein
MSDKKLGQKEIRNNFKDQNQTNKISTFYPTNTSGQQKWPHPDRFRQDLRRQGSVGKALPPFYGDIYNNLLIP